MIKDCLNCKQGRDGNGWCKECFAEHEAARQKLLPKANRARARFVPEEPLLPGQVKPPDAPPTRRCSKCGLTKSVHAFSVGQSWCKDCFRSERRRRIESEPGYADRIRGYQLKHAFGVPLEDYKRQAEEQGNACAICKQPALPGRRQLAVDHDNESGLLRGLLCVNCNTGIGKFKHDVERLRAAIAYLEHWSTK